MRRFAWIASWLLLGTSWAAAQDHILTVTDGVAAVGTEVTVRVEYDNNSTDAVAAWSLGVCHEEAMVDIVDAVSGSTTLTVAGGGLPEFLVINIIPNGDSVIEPGETPGANTGVLISFLSLFALAPGNGYEMFELTYSLDQVGESTVQMCDTTPAGLTLRTAIALVGGFGTAPHTEIDGTLTATADAAVLAPATFVRGDCNTDGVFDLADIVESLEYLFTGGPSSLCDDACDANDDGDYDVADSIYNVDSMFFGGPLPPAPSAGCGEDPTDDALECASFAACP